MKKGGRYPKGECAVCGKRIALSLNGTTFAHASDYSTTTGYSLSGYYCPGTYQQPKTRTPAFVRIELPYQQACDLRDLLETALVKANGAKDTPDAQS